MSPTAATVAELTRVLRAQRGLLERLQLSSTSVRLLLAVGESRFLPAASDEVHDLLDALAATEAMRATLATQLAELLGVAHDPAGDTPATPGGREPRLAELLAALPADEAAVLGAQGVALSEAVREAQESGGEGVGLAEMGLRKLLDVIDRATGATSAPERPAYGPSGRGFHPAPPPPVRFDQGV